MFGSRIANYGNRSLRVDGKDHEGVRLKKTFTNVRVCRLIPGPDTCSTAVRWLVQSEVQ